MKNILYLFIFMIPLGIQAQTITEALPPDPLPSGIKLLYITKEKDQNKIKIHWSFDSNYVANNSTFEFSVSLENHHGQANYTIQKSVLLDYDSAIHFNNSFEDVFKYNYPHYPDSNSAAFRSVEITLFHDYYVHDIIYDGEIITKINYRNQFPHLFEDFEKAYPRFMRLVNDVPTYQKGGIDYPIIHNWSEKNSSMWLSPSYWIPATLFHGYNNGITWTNIHQNYPGDLHETVAYHSSNHLGSELWSNGAFFSRKNRIRLGYIELFPNAPKSMYYSVEYYSYGYFGLNNTNIRGIGCMDRFGNSSLGTEPGVNGVWMFATPPNNSFYWSKPIDSIPQNGKLKVEKIHNYTVDSIAYFTPWEYIQPVDNFKYLRHYSDTLCAGVGLEINGQWTNQSGLYIDSMLTTWGTDSIVARSVHFLPSSYTDTTSASICSGDSVLFMGDYYASG
ncbi:MAG: hypothetical protein N4A45_07715, partial [Flavobacteriales bacterium]|nr:hypothetical protein [Flavobacteriales bacterium]